jgi:hypothetical protein
VATEDDRKRYGISSGHVLETLRDLRKTRRSLTGYEERAAAWNQHETVYKVDVLPKTGMDAVVDFSSAGPRVERLVVHPDGVFRGGAHIWGGPASLVPQPVFTETVG